MEIQRQQAQASTNNGNGKDDNADATPPADDAERYCDFHEAPLTRYSKNGQVWYSHYNTESGKWCRGK